MPVPYYLLNFVYIYLHGNLGTLQPLCPWSGKPKTLTYISYETTNNQPKTIPTNGNKYIGNTHVKSVDVGGVKFDAFNTPDI